MNQRLGCEIMKKVIVFAGTNEGRKISEFLAANDIPVTACVATEYGALVMPKMNNLHIQEGRLSKEEIEKIIGNYDLIIDATHPHAKIVSENIAWATQKAKKESIRIIRPLLTYENVIAVSNIEEACQYINRTKGNILITTGSKELEQYTKVEDYQERLFFRTLPTMDALNALNQISIKATQIICMQGPFTQNLNQAMLEQIDAQYLVTKEAGKSGGLLEKLAAAKALRIKVIVIGRPTIEEGLDLDEAYLFLKEKLDLEKKSLLHLSHFPAVFSDEEIIGGLISQNGEYHKKVREKATKLRAFLNKGVQ